jgi:hypothetical protein
MKRRLLLAALTSVAVSGCALPPLAREVPLLRPELTTQPSKPENSKVLIYNNSNRLAFLLTGKMHVRLNGRGVAALEIGEYVQIEVPKGKHTLMLSHWDMIVFNSIHELNVDASSIFVEIQATPVSNSMKVHPNLPPSSELPRGFRPSTSLSDRADP